jgi:hypothetical protein
MNWISSFRDLNKWKSYVEKAKHSKIEVVEPEEEEEEEEEEIVGFHKMRKIAV